jgi:hypothetical protein
MHHVHLVLLLLESTPYRLYVADRSYGNQNTIPGEEMKQLIVGLVLLVMLGCGGSDSGGNGGTATPTSYAGDWWYSDSNMVINAKLSPASDVPGYGGLSGCLGKLTIRPVGSSPGGGYDAELYWKEGPKLQLSNPTYYGNLSDAYVVIETPSGSTAPPYTDLTCTIQLAVYGPHPPTTTYKLTRIP